MTDNKKTQLNGLRFVVYDGFDAVLFSVVGLFFALYPAWLTARPGTGLPGRFSSPLSYADPLLGSACDCAFLLFRLSLFLNFKNKACGYTGFSDYAGAS